MGQMGQRESTLVVSANKESTDGEVGAGLGNAVRCVSRGWIRPRCSDEGETMKSKGFKIKVTVKVPRLGHAVAGTRGGSHCSKKQYIRKNGKSVPKE